MINYIDFVIVLNDEEFHHDRLRKDLFISQAPYFFLIDIEIP